MSILIKGGFVVTMRGREIIKDGAILIEGNRIAEIGRVEEVAKEHRVEKVIDADKKLVTPGFINAHEHNHTSLMNGMSIPEAKVLEFRDLFDFLAALKFPFLEELMENDIYVSALLGCVRNIKSGATCIADQYYAPKGRNQDGNAEAAVDSGIRSMLARGFHSIRFRIPDAFIEPEDEIIKEYTRMFGEWHNKAEGRIKVWPCPVNMIFCTPESIVKVKDLADKYDSGLHAHVAEDRHELEIIKERYGTGVVEKFYELGVLERGRFQAAHCIYVSDAEIEMLRKTGAAAVHNPVGNVMGGMGVCPVLKMLKAGVTVALGTDGFGDMIEAMRLAIGLQNLSAMKRRALTEWDALRMATIEGANAFGLDKEIGSLEVGKKADITIIDLNRPHIVPVHDPVYALINHVKGNDVDTVIVDGKVVMENRQMKTVNEGEVLEKAREIASKMAEKMKKYWT